MTRITLNNINAEIARRGHPERLIRGEGYFYFIEGDAHKWPCCSVPTMHLTGGRNTVESWADDRDRLAADYDAPDPETCRYCGKGLVKDTLVSVCDDCAEREGL